MSCLERTARGKRLGIDALCCILRIGIEQLNMRRYIAKISFSNEASLVLFKEKLGFSVVSESRVFQEVTLERIVDDAFNALLKEKTAHVSLDPLDLIK